MRIEYTAEAARDLDDAVEHVFDESPVAATRLGDRILRVIERLAAREFEGPEVELATGERVRSWPVSPFRVLYRRDADVLLVVRVFHQARKPITR